MAFFITITDVITDVPCKTGLQNIGESSLKYQVDGAGRWFRGLKKESCYKVDGLEPNWKSLASEWSAK